MLTIAGIVELIPFDKYKADTKNEENIKDKYRRRKMKGASEDGDELDDDDNDNGNVQGAPDCRQM